MGVNISERSGLRFGVFELDRKNGELRKDGIPIKLQPQPFKVLALLASRAGQVITREEIQEQIWSSETFVDFRQGLNFCIRQVRAALGDDAETPRYIETLPRRGYRFIAHVEELTWPQASSPAGKLMLAVLPFANLTGDPGQEYFSDGLTDEMITQLGRVHPERLGVISRTSAMKYKHTDKGVDQIGRELGVAYVLEGSVRRMGYRVRITAQLIQVTDQTHLWAESYERHLRDILALQSEVARAIAGEIRVKLTPQEQARLVTIRPVDPEIYQLYLKGRYHWHKRTREGLKKSIAYFHQAVDLDPNYALAYAGLADSYLTLLDFGYLPPREATAHANAAAVKALELDETLAEAHTSLAHTKMHEWDWADAEREFKRALELNPSYATAHFYYANYLAALRRLDEAVGEARQTQQLDPVSPMVESNAALMFYFARQYEQAIEQSQKALEMDPNYAPAHHDLGLAYEQKQMFGPAIAALQKAVALSSRSLRSMAVLGHAYAVSGKKNEALKLMKQLRQRAREGYVSPYDLAVLSLGLGDKDQAFGWLEKAYEERSAALTFLKVDPRLEPLRSEPGFLELMRRVGLPRPPARAHPFQQA